MKRQSTTSSLLRRLNRSAAVDLIRTEGVISPSSLAAAALQFSLRTEIVGSTVVGVSSPSRLEETAALADAVIPPELWRELETLVPPRETWLS
jgi:aryl-alcohol dehydrogenase-like predicted oxidoreductase